MKNLRQYDACRTEHPLAGWGDETCGLFMIPAEDDDGRSIRLKVLASSGQGWDHVSVSLPDRCPSWLEMCQIHRLFFEDGEEAMQLHVPAADHISHHPYCLHLWRPNEGPSIPRPPGAFVAPKDLACGASD